MTRGGTGGAGFSGAFSAMGDATSQYFDKLRENDARAEQQRQFNANLAQNQQQIDAQAQRDELSRFDRLDQSLASFEQDLSQRGKYMSDAQRKAYTEFVQRGRAATMSYWAAGDKSGFDEWSATYGPGKAWGEDENGQPITLDSINADVFKNKPIKDQEERLGAVIDQSYANLLSSSMADTYRTTETDNILQSLQRKEITPAQAGAQLVAANKNNLGMLRSGLSRPGVGINGKSLALVEDTLKLLPKSEATESNDDYKFLQNLIDTNRGAIDTYRAGLAITEGGKGAVLGYDMDSLSYDAGKYQFARTQFTDKRSDANTLATLIAEGDYQNLSSASGKAEYFRVHKETDPNLSDAQIEASYQEDLAEAKDTYTIKQGVIKSQATILGNQALSSTMDVQSKKVLHDALLPFLAGDAVSQRNLEALVRDNNITEAQFTAKILPTLLNLRGKIEINGMLRTLAESPGGVGRAALNAAHDSGLIDDQTYEGMNAYAATVQDLYSKGVNVQAMALGAQFMREKLDKYTSQAALDLKLPTLQARNQAQAAMTQIAQNTVTELLQKGLMPYALKMGASQGQVALSQDAAAIIIAKVNEAVASGQLPLANQQGRLTAQAAISAAVASIAQSEFTTAFTTAQDGATQGAAANRATIATSGATETQANFQSAFVGAQNPAAQGAAANSAAIATSGATAAQAGFQGDFYNAQDGTTQGAAAQGAAVAGSNAAAAQGQYTTAYAQGGLPFAGQLAAGDARATLQEQTLRLKQAAATVSLIPTATEAQKQQYVTAIATGKFDEALAILKTNNVDFDYQMLQAGTMQQLAELDPKASLAGSIKNPRTRAMYQNAVRLQNEQRAQAAALQAEQLKIAQAKTQQDTASLTNKDLIDASSEFRQQAKAVYTNGNYAQAIDSLKKTNGITVDTSIPGRARIIVTSNDPEVRRVADQARSVIEAANLEAQGFLDQSNNYLQELNRRQFGQPNPNPNGQGGASYGTGQFTRIRTAPNINPSGFNPELTSRLEQLIATYRAPNGLIPIITQGNRTDEEQAALYAKGRTTPGPGASAKNPMGNIVTNARPGTSNHQKGEAVDISWQDPRTGKILAGNDPRAQAAWDSMGALAPQYGLTWGGKFQFVDKYHFELDTSAKPPRNAISPASTLTPGTMTQTSVGVRPGGTPLPTVKPTGTGAPQPAAKPAAAPAPQAKPTPAAPSPRIQIIKGTTTKYTQPQLRAIQANPKFAAGFASTDPSFRKEQAVAIAGDLLMRTPVNGRNPSDKPDPKKIQEVAADIFQMMNTAKLPKGNAGSPPKPNTPLFQNIFVPRVGSVIANQFPGAQGGANKTVQTASISMSSMQQSIPMIKNLPPQTRTTALADGVAVANQLKSVTDPQMRTQVIADYVARSFGFKTAADVPPNQQGKLSDYYNQFYAWAQMAGGWR